MQLFTNAPSLRAATLASIILLGACSKKDDDATPIPVIYNTTWTADGKNYTGTNKAVKTASGRVTLSTYQAIGQGDTCAIRLDVPAAPGTYNLDIFDNVGSYFVTVGGTTDIYVSYPGTLTITTFSATAIVGTFSFQGKSPALKEVTNGKFTFKR